MNCTSESTVCLVQIQKKKIGHMKERRHWLNDALISISDKDTDKYKGKDIG